MIYVVAGTRPNFMKVAPIVRELRARSLPFRLMHTGQHFDEAMSDVFFRDLAIPDPDARLHVGGGTHAEQTAAALVGIERDLIASKPRIVVVVGDVTSTLAAALAAAKLGLDVAHVEAGLRSRDWSMPEEINRVLTDRLSKVLLIPSRDAEANLIAEGIERERIHFVGNVMIDSLHFARENPTDALSRLNAQPWQYALATLHRPANVDTEEALAATLDALSPVIDQMPVFFPVHPRTLARLKSFGLIGKTEASNLRTIAPLGYRDFVTLMSSASVVLTDSGGIQEETTALGIPCLTMRPNTERPITIALGTNVLVGLDKAKIAKEVSLLANRRKGTIPEGWDGQAAKRIVDLLTGS